MASERNNSGSMAPATRAASSSWIANRSIISTSYFSAHMAAHVAVATSCAEMRIRAADLRTLPLSA
jgi:hypothetical protein